MRLNRQIDVIILQQLVVAEVAGVRAKGWVDWRIGDAARTVDVLQAATGAAADDALWSESVGVWGEAVADDLAQ